MDMPPTRFRVVERGRRLEVIDTATGKPVAGTSRFAGFAPPLDAARTNTPLKLDQGIRGPAVPPTRSRPTPGGLPRTTRFDGTVSFTTRAFYDDRAPRIVTLDPARAKIVRWVAFAVLVLLIVTPALLLMLAWSSFPLLIVLAAVAFNPKARERLRAIGTSLIDRYAESA